MSHSIAIYNFKGGVGKTTTAINLGISWSRSFKVLLIDFDPQSNLSNSISISRSRQTTYSAVKNILHDHPLNLEPTEITPYLHLIHGDFLMTEFESNNQFISFGSSIISDLISQVKGDYDFIIMDCPTNFGVLVKSIIRSSQNILIPAIADNFSITGIQQLMTYIAASNNDSLNILGIFFNMFNGQLKLSQEKFNDAKQKFGQLILENTVSRSIKVGEANDIGQSVSEYSPDNSAAKDFVKLSDELLAKFHTTSLNEDFIIPDLLETISKGV
ncbi:ParA family protein [Marinoscillum furvescens]|uniref:Chromosome partitioning protein n=1 Tax=Marinoscillum furvescens DSM 4134 TaxID=1122208 RepID=A0A3D9L2B4_MARFU|nr:ParA family protein [Marinoscillum furvescens]RED97526.1 chromosome partitioning protein [Marinoscillum furvescens DSM 4134]